MVSNTSKSGFEFVSAGIASVLKNHRLKVPPYQREYAWGKEEVEQLFSDFNSAKSEGRDYFLGTIVTVKSQDGKFLEIVDGQQRLTTTAIFMTAIKEHLKLLGETAQMMVESIENEFLTTIDRIAGKRVPRLSLNIDDNAFFESILNGGGAPSLQPSRDSHRLLESAKSAAIQYIKNIARLYSTQDLPARLNDWIEYLDNNATVILLQTVSASQAFKMFETLNDRGMKTNQADLVKSYLFGQSSTRINEAIAKWSSIRNNLEDLNDDDRLINFLRHAFIATRHFVRADEIYEETQKSIRGELASTNYLAELENISSAYVASYSPDSDFWNGCSTQAKNALRVINKFDIKPIRPLVLALAMNFDKGELDATFALLTSISVRLLIASATRSGTNEQTFASAAQSVSKRDIKNVLELKSALMRVIIGDVDFKEAFSTARSSKPEYARYYLRCLEAAKAQEMQPWYVPNDDPASITLEHILPKVIEPSYQWDKFSEEEADRCVKRLGNLCLLQKTPNSDLDNSSFNAKLPILRESPYYFTSHISDYVEWSPEMVDLRQKNMADWAIKAWSI